MLVKGVANLRFQILHPLLCVCMFFGKDVLDTCWLKMAKALSHVYCGTKFRGTRLAPPQMLRNTLVKDYQKVCTLLMLLKVWLWGGEVICDCQLLQYHKLLKVSSPQVSIFTLSADSSSPAWWLRNLLAPASSFACLSLQLPDRWHLSHLVILPYCFPHPRVSIEVLAMMTINPARLRNTSLDQVCQKTGSVRCHLILRLGHYNSLSIKIYADFSILIYKNL